MRGRRRVFYSGRNSNIASIIRTVVLVVCAAAIIVILFCLRVKDKPDEALKFVEGVRINNIDLNGMTYESAEKTIGKLVDERLQSMDIECSADGKPYNIPASDFVTSSAEETLSLAYEASCDAKVQKPCNFYITYYADAAKLTAILEKIAEETNVEPTEPVSTFDAETRSFTYIEGKSGKSLNVKECLDILLDKTEKGETFASLIYDVTYPLHTTQDLRENTVKIAEFSSITTNNYNRNRNIQLMCMYVDGVEIKPGEILSINELVGERTAEKGFLPAPAIMDGKRTVDDYGGGICQLSGTLYNAALLANMKIAERWPHSWPSDYLDIGLDSTLDWNTQKDLKIQNPTEYSMFISARMESSDLSSGNKVKIEIYGKAFPKGVTVKVYSEITETTQPEPQIVRYSDTLKTGQSSVVTKQRTGYRTRVWREFYCNGVLLDSEIVGTSWYAPIRGEIIVGTGYVPEPTPTPSETPIIIEPPAPTPPPENG